MRANESVKTTPNGERNGDTNAESAQDAQNAGLVYVSDNQPGIRRVRRGQRFAYVGPDNKPIHDEDELQRIAKLAIPPAYTDVWICRNPRGHLQATGRDARGRKQYRYHPKWRLARDDNKFDRMAEFGAALPKLRRRIRRDLGLPGLPRDKVLAVVCNLLDTTRIRIGNPEYARDNNSFGLTTLRNRHVTFIRDQRAVLRFRGKGGAEHEIVVDDRRIVSIVRRCQHLPGQMLFQYIDDAGERHAIDSDMVNTYLREAMCGEFTAKDFRTWGATLRAIGLMACMPLPERTSERALNACIVETVRQVARELRNTPAVCRKSYINPLVFSAWRDGVLHQLVGEKELPTRQAERVAIKFLEALAKRRDAPAAGAKRRTGTTVTGTSHYRPTFDPASGRHRQNATRPTVGA
jgi:DNA topoisomerase-1